MAKKLIKYSVVDAFTEKAFKGNPAAVCWLKDIEKDDKWLQSVATEFNISETCYLTPIINHGSENPRFNLRWFTPVAEVDLCGHATLAASHFLFESGLVNSDTIEFSTLSGILTAKKVAENGASQTSFLIELNFPVVAVSDFKDDEVSAISEILNGVSVVEVKKTASDDILVVLPSAKEVVEFEPQLDKMKKAPGRGILITGCAPNGSGLDFYSRFFSPKYGIDEDPVTGSAHCALAAYWTEKLEKCDFIAYQASPRSGILDIHLDKKNQRVLLRGRAITVMEGSLLLVKYSVVDAFTETAFKGNPAAVCWLADIEKDDKWLQSVATEFNISDTCYLTPIVDHGSENPRFKLRWFTPVAENLSETISQSILCALEDQSKISNRNNVPILICSILMIGQTLWSCYFSSLPLPFRIWIGIEFSTLSGILTAKKVPETRIKDSSGNENGAAQASFMIELNFPVVPVSDFNDLEVSAISEILNGVSTVDVKKLASDDILVVLPSGKEVAELEPQLDKIKKKAPGSCMRKCTLCPSSLLERKIGEM
ncbi:hypothetical protein LXL04_001092 [Taraxacum kok-saghyz]